MMSKLVWGVGVNDADYKVTKTEKLGNRTIQVWMCPFYLKWSHMLERCYSEAYHRKQPTYIGCSTVPEWHYFMTFRAWMEKQDWEGKHLDKDILFPGNRIYSPDACVFVSQGVNAFFNEKANCRGVWPIGVNFDKNSGKFKSQCSETSLGKNKSLGYFDTPEEAHKAWLTFKLEQAKILASEQSDPRVAKALIKRYENYGEHN